MTAQQFVKQLSRADSLIKIMVENLEKLNSDLTRLCGSGYEEHYNRNRNTDAPFVRIMEKKMELEKRVRELIETRQKVLDAIYDLSDCDERIILLYRYQEHMTYREIARMMYCDHKTVMYKHDKALSHLRY